ncbi:MAG: FAD-dependent oxidoreductase, partial [Candidatus Nanopelagicales bacterium]
MSLGSISPATRQAALDSMGSQVLDLLVVGAGATGCGTALDAATRGLAVAMIDKGDIAGGTSSRSSKLVHGGLRYLQQGDVGLVRE